MKALIVSEWRKVRTTATAWWLGAAAIGVAVITAIGTRAGEFPVGRPLVNPLIRNMPVFVGLFVLVLGVRSVTDEFRYGTITPTVLASPSRGRIVAAKAVVSGLMGAAFVVAAEAVAIGLTVMFASAEGPVTIEGSVLVTLVGGTAAAGALTAMFGVGLGAIVRHQVAAVVGGLVWFLLAEDLLAAVLREPGRWLPVQAAHGLNQIARPDLLAMETAAIVFGIYAVAVAVAGGLVTRRRDVA